MIPLRVQVTIPYKNAMILYRDQAKIHNRHYISRVWQSMMLRKLGTSLKTHALVGKIVPPYFYY